ncbi:hypothetical protein EDD66_105111 [Mobilisporobacter senegalensis]|uniref:Uncharacterized protein n=1 Tax=Mobilisporobacter senegalensis TaxID=1329262 RepID=A0A3N1XSL5_9FIRM|nr:hypothetical protein [Mobilisporobacter senegalensis]ROR28172.1 hypothetical protein EDD66_105111 [Mobilisporobacter senegalensis]
MKFLKKGKFNLLIFSLLVFVLGATGIVYAKEITVEKIYKSKSEIQESITEKENVIPLYSLEKVGDSYKVIYRNQTEEEIKKDNELLNNEPISYEKKVRNYYYKSVSSIPESIDYSEYNNEYEYMFIGKLDLISVTACGKDYIAEYKGILSNK